MKIIMQIQITITDQLKSYHEAVKVVKENEHGVTIGEYLMPLSEIINCLTQSVDQGVVVETPILPRGCIKLQTSPLGHIAYLDIPKQQWLISYNDQSVRVGFPRMIFKYDVFKDELRSMHIVAVPEKGRIKGDTPLYHFPYTNVDKEHAKVCMGTNEMPSIKNLTQLETVHDLFFSAPFGDDYGCMLTEGQNFRTILPLVQDKPFSDDWLIPIGKTFNEFFSLNN